MENKITTLFNYIIDKKREYVELADCFGDDHFIVSDLLKEITGMEKAFEVISGENYIDYFIAHI